MKRVRRRLVLAAAVVADMAAAVVATAAAVAANHAGSCTQGLWIVPGPALSLLRVAGPGRADARDT